MTVLLEALLRAAQRRWGQEVLKSLKVERGKCTLTFLANRQSLCKTWVVWHNLMRVRVVLAGHPQMDTTSPALRITLDDGTAHVQGRRNVGSAAELSLVHLGKLQHCRGFSNGFEDT